MQHLPTLVALFSPSRNPESHSVCPSLAHDFSLVETSVSRSTSRSSDTSPGSSCISLTEIADQDMAVDNEVEHSAFENTSHTADPILSIAFAPQETPLRLQTPARTGPHGCLQSDIRLSWGSDLELASPRISQPVQLATKQASFTNSYQEAPSASGLVQASFVSQNAVDPAIRSPSLLDLNSHCPDFPPAENQINVKELSSSLKSPANRGTAFLELEETAKRQQNCPEIAEHDAEIESLSVSLAFGTPKYCSIYTGNAKNQAAKLMRSDGSVESCPKDHKTNAGAQAARPNSKLSIPNPVCNAIGWYLEKAISSTTSSDDFWGAANHVKLACKQLQQSSNSPATSSTRIDWTVTREDKHTKRITSTSERVAEITLDDLAQYFPVPISQASKELKIGLTILKKRCRELGIRRWPHRKMRSLDSLIGNIQVFETCQFEWFWRCGLFMTKRFLLQADLPHRPLLGQSDLMGT